MNFVANQEVKAFVKLGSQKEKNWQTVRFYETIVDNELYSVTNGTQVVEVNWNEIRYFKQITEVDIESFCKQNIESLIQSVNVLVERFNLNYLEVDNQDQQLSFLGGAVTINASKKMNR